MDGILGYCDACLVVLHDWHTSTSDIKIQKQFQTEQCDGQTALAKQVHGKVYEYQHGDMSECVTAVNSTETVPVPVGEPVDERNLLVL